MKPKVEKLLAMAFTVSKQKWRANLPKRSVIFEYLSR